MKTLKTRKPQQDRLLKTLNSMERRRQEKIRQLILQEQLFKIV